MRRAAALPALLASALLGAACAASKPCPGDASCSQAERCAATCPRWNDALARPPDACRADPIGCGDPTAKICSLEPDVCRSSEVLAFVELRNRALACGGCPD